MDLEQVRCLLDDRDACCRLLESKGSDRDHGKAAIFDFCCLHGLLCAFDAVQVLVVASCDHFVWHCL